MTTPFCTPHLTTQRLELRPFAPGDAPALLDLLGDAQVNTFLPMFPLGTLREAEEFLRSRYLRPDAEGVPGARCAICLKGESRPIGYIHVGGEAPYDFGYALQRAYWHRGITTEAGRALLDWLHGTGLPYVTATHDVNNPHSGAVMRKLGMQYCYSYREQWQPKNFEVVFRLYQLNLDGRARVYDGYRERYPNFVEEHL